MCSRFSNTFSKHGSRFLAIILTLGAAGGLLAQTTTVTSAPAPADAKPKLEVSTTVWDFGEKWSGEPAETTLTLRNSGDAPLHIDRLKTSCGCTAARIDNKVLQPGRAEDVKVSYNTKKLKENVTQTIHVYSDDPDSPDTTVTVRGRVRPLVRIGKTQSLDFGSLGRDDAITKSVEVECNYTQPLELKLQPEQPDYFDVELTEVERGKTYRLTVTTKPPLRDGRLNTNLKLETGLSWMPTVPLRVSGFVQQPVIVTPAILYTTTQATPAHRRLRLLSRREHPVRVLKVVPSHPAIAAEVMSGEPDRSPANDGADATLIDVTLPSGAELPAEGATLTIMTDDEEFGELVVPVRFRSQMARRTAAPGAESPPAREAVTPAERPSGDVRP